MTFPRKARLIACFPGVLPRACTSPQKALFLSKKTSSRPVEPGPAQAWACHLSHRQFKSPSCDDLWCRTQAAARHLSVGCTRDVSCVASLQCSVLPGCLPIVVSPAQNTLRSCGRRQSQLLVTPAGLLEAGGCLQRRAALFIFTSTLHRVAAKAHGEVSSDPCLLQTLLCQVFAMQTFIHQE